MQRNARTVKKVVQVLTDPQPEFVSLVNHGANQTPWRVVKAAGRATVDIQKITFDKSEFKDEESVKSYLDARGYDGYEIVSKSDSFEVPGKDAAEFEDGLETIKTQKGITMTVGRVRIRKSAAATEGQTSAEQTTKAAEAAPVEVNPGAEGPVPFLAIRSAGPAEVVAKWDGWIASYSEATTVEEVLKAGADGLPPAINELNAAFYTALRNNLLSGNSKGVKGVCAEFGDLIVKLADVFGAAVGGEQTQKAAVITAIFAPEIKADEPAPTDASKSVEAPAPEGNAPVVEAAATTEQSEQSTETAKGTETPVVTEPEAPASTETQKAEPADPVAAAVAKAMEGVGAIVAAAIAPIATAITDLQARTVKTDGVEAAEPAAEGVTKAAEAEIEPRQTRKSGDIDDVSAASTQKTEQQDERTQKFAARQRRNVMGI